MHGGQSRDVIVASDDATQFFEVVVSSENSDKKFSLKVLRDVNQVI